MGIFLLFWSLTIVSSAITNFRYRTDRIKDVGKDGYKFDTERLVDFFEVLPDMFTFQLFIPVYNMYKANSIYSDYKENKDYYHDLLCRRKILNRMDDNEYTEYRQDKNMFKLLDISERNDEDKELLHNIEDFLFDIASYNNKYEDKKVLSFGVDEESHFDVYYDNDTEDFVTLEQTGMFDDLDENVKMNFLLNIINFFGTVYGNYGQYKDKINNKDGVIKLNAEGYDFSIQFKNLYEYIPDNIFDEPEESLHSKLLKK